MSNSELFLLVATLGFTLIGCILAVFIFVRQYKREMHAKEMAASQKKQAQQNAKTAEK